MIFGNKYVRFASLDSQFNINLLRFASIFKFFKIKMFASLRKNFRTIERVRFASIFKETSLSKVSLRFASITMSFAFDDSDRELN